MVRENICWVATNSNAYMCLEKWTVNFKNCTYKKININYNTTGGAIMEKWPNNTRLCGCGVYRNLLFVQKLPINF